VCVSSSSVTLFVSSRQALDGDRLRLLLGVVGNAGSGAQIVINGCNSSEIGLLGRGGESVSGRPGGAHGLDV
jgi:hypothetical protein